MATEFILDISTTTIPVKIKDGESIVFEKTYSMDLGNKEKIQQIFSAGQALSDKAKELKENAEALDKVEELARGLIEASIGDWSDIWEASRHNVYAVMALAFYIAKTVKDESTGSLKRYGL